MPWWVNAGRIATFVVPLIVYIAAWIYAIYDSKKYGYSKIFRTMTYITIYLFIVAYVTWCGLCWILSYVK